MNYQELKTLVKHHCYLYYDVNQPELSDEDFDKLYDTLEDMEDFQGWADFDSPTRYVGGKPGKVKHMYKLYSLKKVYDKEEVDTSFTVVTPKIDGANVTLYYFDGELRLALTRGDGEFGEDVTALIRTVTNIPRKLATNTKELVVNGECVTDNEVSNFRNYVSGALGLDSVEEFKTREIKFIAHDWLGIDINYKARMEVVKSAGFNTVFDSDLCSKYPQDGVVYRLDSYKESINLGWTSKYPRFAVALKPRGVTTKQTQLQNVIWVVGRTGTVNPVGIVSPVTLDDAIITRVTLHNIGIIEDNDLALGDIIEIERAGGVIPKFLRVVERTLTNTKITASNAEEQLGVKTYREGPKLYCEDAESHSKSKMLEHFIETMKIKGLGPASVKKMGITHPLEIYQDQDWSKLGKNGAKVELEVAKSTSVPYHIVLAALGIPQVGPVLAERIAAKIPSFKRLRDIEITEVPDVGPKTVESILSWVDVNEEWVLELPLNLEKDLTVKDVAMPRNKKVCITGKLDITRDKLAEILTNLGYTVTDTVTKDLYALISGGGTTTGRKHKMAEKYGTRIIEYETNRENILAGLF